MTSTASAALLTFFAFTFAAGCGDSDSTPLDSGVPGFDVGPRDSGSDTAPPMDSGGSDAGTMDSGSADAGEGDGGGDGGADTGAADSGAPDGGSDAGGGDGGADTGAADAGATTAPGPGDLVIVELMGNPQSVTDAMGEYFEVINVSTRTLDLSGVTITHTAYSGGEPTASTGSHVIGTSVEIAPGARALLGVHSFVAGGGVTVDYVYSGFLFSNGSTMANRLRLQTPSWGGTEPPAAAELIDQVIAPAGTFQNTNRGRAWQLDPALIDPPTTAGSDDPANFCHTPMRAALEYRSTNWGTPREINDCTP